VPKLGDTPKRIKRDDGTSGSEERISFYLSLFITAGQQGTHMGKAN